jgi:hypothetical protein
VSLHDELHYGEELHSVTTQIEVKSHIRNFIKKLLLSTNFKSFIKTYLVVRYIEYPIGTLKWILLNIVYCIYKEPYYNEPLTNKKGNTISWKELFKKEYDKEAYWRSHVVKYGIYKLTQIEHPENISTIHIPERVLRVIISGSPKRMLQYLYRRLTLYPIFGFKSIVKNIIHLFFFIIRFLFKLALHLGFLYYTWIPLIWIRNNSKILRDNSYFIKSGNISLKGSLFATLLRLLTSEQFDTYLLTEIRIFPLFHHNIDKNKYYFQDPNRNFKYYNQEFYNNLYLTDYRDIYEDYDYDLTE